MDYSYEYTSLETSSSSGGMIVYMIIMLAVAVFSIVSMWKVFKKAGKEGWAALIPIYKKIIVVLATFHRTNNCICISNNGIYQLS